MGGGELLGIICFGTISTVIYHRLNDLKQSIRQKEMFNILFRRIND
jgi:hypothetical protein